MPCSPYLERLRRVCDDPAQLASLEGRLTSGARALLRDQRPVLAPSWRRAALCIFRSVALAAAALACAGRAIDVGWWPLAVLLVYVAGLGMFGLFSVFHDAAHGSFLPRRRMNPALGWAIGSVLMLDFEDFRRSHLQHHRNSQSGRDPKRLGIPDVREDGSPLLFGPVDEYPRLLRAWARAGDRLLARPRWVRLAFYVFSWLAVAPFFIMLTGAEFSLTRRRWSQPRRWAALATSVIGYGAVAAVSPRAAALLLGATASSYAFTFLLFVTHLGPDQLYTQVPVFSPALAALNVSDLRLGRWFEVSGHGFAENHAAHHLVPHVPAYALAPVSRWLADGFGPLKAPPIDFNATAIVAIGDAMIAFGTKPRGEGWERWNTPGGPLLRRSAASLAPAAEVAAGLGAGS